MEELASVVDQSGHPPETGLQGNIESPCLQLSCAALLLGLCVPFLNVGITIYNMIFR